MIASATLPSSRLRRDEGSAEIQRHRTADHQGGNLKDAMRHNPRQEDRPGLHSQQLKQRKYSADQTDIHHVQQDAQHAE